MSKKRKKNISIPVPKPIMFPIIVQEWMEFEGNNIIMPVGFTIHLTLADRELFLNNYWEREKQTFRGRMPLRYIHEEGTPVTTQAKERMYKRLIELRAKDKYGMWITELSLLEPNEYDWRYNK